MESSETPAPQLTEMNFCEGSRMGSLLYYTATQPGYLYRVKRRRGRTLYFSCANKGCRAVSNLKQKRVTNRSKSSVQGLFEITTTHSHSEDVSMLTRLLFESACKKRSMNEDTPYSVIIKEEKERYDVNDIKETSLISTLYQARKRCSVGGYFSSNSGDSADEEHSQLWDSLSHLNFGECSNRWRWVLPLIKQKNCHNKNEVPSDKSITESENLPHEDGTHSNDEKVEIKSMEVGSDDNFDSQRLFSRLQGEDITITQLKQSYGFKRLPLQIPCPEKCPTNPYCLGGYPSGDSEQQLPPHLTPRGTSTLPISIQQTPKTSALSNALLVLYHMRKFRNLINSQSGFSGSESLSHLIQIIFADMDSNQYRCLSTEEGSTVDKLYVFISKHSDCVSPSDYFEFCLDWTISETSLAPTLAPLTTVTVARTQEWRCGKCSTVHRHQLLPSTSYSLTAISNKDQTELKDCLSELLPETQSSFEVVCQDPHSQKAPSGSYCGAAGRTERTVTSKIHSTPYYLLVRREGKDSPPAPHMVYPEHLNLSQYTHDGKAAHYLLSAVIFKAEGLPYTCQIKTSGGRWISFSGDEVTPMDSRKLMEPGTPSWSHPNYLSSGSVNSLYISTPGVRVSRGPILFLYTLLDHLPAAAFEPPKQSVLNYLHSHVDELDNVSNKVQTDRASLLKDITVQTPDDPLVFIPESLISNWLSSKTLPYQIPSSQLDVSNYLCSHGKIDLKRFSEFKCMRQNMLTNLFTSQCGIRLQSNSDATILNGYPEPNSFLMDESTLCRSCVLTIALFISFTDEVHSLHKQFSRESVNYKVSGCQLIGTESLEKWPQIALRKYHEDKNLQNIVNITFKEDLLLNSEIVCVHSQLDPTANVSWIPMDSYRTILKLCDRKVNSASLDDFDVCNWCQKEMKASDEALKEALDEKKKLNLLFCEKKRPHPEKDEGKEVYLLNRNFYEEWRTYIRNSSKNLRSTRPQLTNDSLLCPHGLCQYNPQKLAQYCQEKLWVTLWPEEWLLLKQFYDQGDEAVSCTISTSMELMRPGVCPRGCVEAAELSNYETYFHYTNQVFYIEQILHTAENEEEAVRESEQEGGEERSKEEEEGVEHTVHSSKRRKVCVGVRSSDRARRRVALQGEMGRKLPVEVKLSSTDTLNKVTSLISGETGMWAGNQSLFLKCTHDLSKVLHLTSGDRGLHCLTAEQLSMTLSQLRLRPGDSIYYQESEGGSPCSPVGRGGIRSPSRKVLKAKSILKKAIGSKKPANKNTDEGRVVELHFTEGSRVGSQLVYPADDEGYVYRVKRVKKSTIYFSCGFTGCRACGNFKRSSDSLVGVFSLTAQHNHLGDPVHLRKLQFESACKKRNVSESNVPATAIIREEMDRWKLTEEDIKVSSLNATLYKARWRLAVEDPNSVPSVTEGSE